MTDKNQEIQELRDTIARQSARIAELTSQVTQLQEQQDKQQSQRKIIDEMPISNWDKVSKLRELGLLESQKKQRPVYDNYPA